MNKALSPAELQPSVVQIPAPAKKRRKPLLMLGALIAIGVAGWYGVQWWQAGRFLVSTDDAYVGGNVTPLAPRVAGHIDQILVEDNQHVAAGQLVIRIDDRPFKAALEHAEASVQQKRSALDNLRAQVSLQNSMIQQAEADLEAKNAVAVFTAQDAKRYEVLASARTGSQQDAQKSAAADGQAQATVAAARAGLAASRKQLDVLNTQISEATAEVAAAKADLDTTQLDLGYTEIRSPIDGIIGNRLAQVAPMSGQLLADDRSGIGVVGRRQFQGRPTAPHGRWAGSDGLYGHCARRAAQGARHHLGAGNGGDLQRDPAAECDGQFHQDCPARSCQDHGRQGPGAEICIEARCGDDLTI